MQNNTGSALYGNRPLVTIGIPTYNRAHGYLRHALESALAQHYEPLEVIVSDNASTDDTEAVVRSYSDSRLRYIKHRTALPPNENFNFCLNQAQGAYFVLLHDDDAIDADFVSASLAAADYRTDVGIIRTGTRRVDAHGSVIDESLNRAASLSTTDFFLAWFEGRTTLYLCSTLYNTRKLREIGGFRSRHNLFQDALATFSLAARYGRIDVSHVKASFRVHGGELTGMAKVHDWCEDSLDLLDAMCRLVSTDQGRVREQGMRFFANVNYSRASKVKPLNNRIAAFVHVYRSFGRRYPPSWRRVFSSTKLYEELRRLKRRMLGRPQLAT